MKSLIAIVAFVVSSIAMYAQKDVTKFLGIPVDGTKSEMIRKLEAKGFKLDKNAKEYLEEDILDGEFNGHDVNVFVVTNNNRVYRIMLCDKQTKGETDIKIRFNRLCNQFENSKKYVPMANDQIIPDDEDISYEILVHKKRYEAGFYQCPDDMIDSSRSYKQIMCPRENLVWFMISEDGSKYYITMYYDNRYNQANGEEL